MTLGHTPTLQTLRLVDGCPLDLELEFVDSVTGDPIDVSGREWELPLAATAGGSALASFAVEDGDETNKLRASITAGEVGTVAAARTRGRWWLKDLTNGIVSMDGPFVVKPAGLAGMAMPGGPTGSVEVRFSNGVTVRATVAGGTGLTPDQEAQLDALALTDGRLGDAVMPPEVVAVTGVVRATGALTNGPPSPMDAFVSGNGMTPTGFDDASTLNLPGVTLVAPAGDHTGLGFVASVAAPEGPDGASLLGATVRGASYTGETATTMLFLTDATGDVVASVPFSGTDQTVELTPPADAGEAMALTVLAFGQVDAEVVLGSVEWQFSTPLGDLTADDIAYTGTGLNAGKATVDQALNNTEGTLDRWRFVSAFATSNVDLSGLVGVGPVAEQPTLDGDAVPALGADVWLFAQADTDENGAYHVDSDTGVWTKWEHPDVFDPPGNGYRVTCNAAGTTVDGTTFMWLDDDPGRFHRIAESLPGDLPYQSSGSGRWLRLPAPSADLTVAP